jgi:hypothetical protein
MANPTEAVASFRALIEPLRDIWKSLDLRVSLVKRNEAWHNVMTTIRLRPDTPPPEPPRKYKIDARRGKIVPKWSGRAPLQEPIELVDFYAGRFEVPISLLDSILDDLEKSKLRIGEEIAHLATLNQGLGGAQTPYSWDAQRFSATGGRMIFGSDEEFKFSALRGWGSSVSTFWDENGWEMLRARLLECKTPFAGLPDIARSLIGFPNGGYLGQTATFIVVAPIYGKFVPEWTQKESNLEVRATIPKTVEPRNVKLISILWQGLESGRESHVYTEADGHDAGRTLELSHALDVSDADSAEFHLLLKGEIADSRSIVLPSRRTENPRLVAHLHFDPDLEKLERFLNPIETDNSAADKFPIAVGWVLALCGFQVAHYGTKGLSIGNEIDLLAFAPYSMSVLAVEVTWAGILNNDKLTKLRRRVDGLASVLPGYEIVPVIATAHERSYPTEDHEASQLEVSVIRPENLRGLVDMARQNRTPYEVLESVKSLRTARVW